MKERNLKNVTLELSAKPFRDDSEETMRAVCERMFLQWKSLTERASQVSVLLWIADGSEILDFSGDLSQTFEWAYWLGEANHPYPANPTFRDLRSPHHCKAPYIASPTPRSYAWLKRLIETVRLTGERISGRKIRVGATFDGGPEFAVSDFKYRRHREILAVNDFVFCDASLHADSHRYAAYPQGIPEGESLGAFLGRQFKEFSRALGYDYLWLSNGMGFGRETWGVTGALFDKLAFQPGKVDETAQAMLGFWRAFRENCPGAVIETRGSNYSAGVEMSTDAAPLRELYREGAITAPVNSPWAAIDFRTGLELSAWMSHIAELPDGTIPYRFYAHDPWWMNSPWLDRYGREPWDIFMPLSVARLTASGEAQGANSVSIMSVDDTKGEMPDLVAREVTNHVLDALDNGPDEPGPFIWVYPFDEYCALVRDSGRRLEQVFNEDTFFGEALQGGAPVNTVISTGNLRKLLAADPHGLKNAILIAPVSAAEALSPFLDAGGKAIVYGSLATASEELRKRLGLACEEPLRGAVTLRSSLAGDILADGRLGDICHIVEQFSNGGLAEVANASDVETFVVATQGASSRVVASKRGNLAFLRALLPWSPDVQPKERFMVMLPPREAFPAERLLRHLLAAFNWKLQASARTPDSLLPRCNLSRHGNAFLFSLLSPDTSCSLRVSSPLGAPILTGMETVIDGGDALWHPGRCWRKECRCFIRQTKNSVVGGQIYHAGTFKFQERRYYSGLLDAEVRFFVPKEREGNLEIISSPLFLWDFYRGESVAPEWEESELGRCVVVRHVTGHLNFAW